MLVRHCIALRVPMVVVCESHTMLLCVMSALGLARVYVCFVSLTPPPLRPLLPTHARFSPPGSLDKSAEDVGTGIVGAPACGDVMKLQVHTDLGTEL